MKNKRTALKSLFILLVILSVGSCSWFFGPAEYVSVKVGETNTCIIDNSGTLHLLYSFNTTTDGRMGVSYVYHSFGAPASGWTTEVLLDGEGNTVYADALGQAPDGSIHAFYRDGSRTVYHAWKTSGGSWQNEIMDGDEAGPVGEVAFDGSGGIHVSRSNYKTDTLLADNLRPLYSYKDPGGSWSTRQISTGSGWVDVNYGRNSSIALDTAGKAHIVFGKEGNLLPFTLGKLYYATAEPVGGTLSEGEIISGSVTGTVENDITISSDGTIHVTFQGYYNPSSKLRYLRSGDGGTTWVPDDGYGDIADATEYSGHWPSTDFLVSGDLQAAYLVSSESGTSYTLKIAARSTAGNWSYEEPDPVIHSCGEVSQVIADDDTTYILYTEDTGEAAYAMFQKLMIAKRVPGEGWVSSPVMNADIPEE